MRPLTPRTRITSLHGVILPPRKKSFWTKTVTLRFVISGAIPSKKNMIWADTNLFQITKRFTMQTVEVPWLKERLKPFIRNSQKYLDWVEEKTPEILKQAAAEIHRYKRFGLIYPLSNVSVKVYHYWKDNVARDNSNKYDTIIDLFSSVGIITDDCWQVVRKNESESECYHGQIVDHITEIYLTVPVKSPQQDLPGQRFLLR